MSNNCSVQVEQFAKNHFVKTFEKKYKRHWATTLLSIIDGLERIEFLLKTEKAETIHGTDNIKIIKTQFRVDGTKESAKTSGNRCIVAWHVEKQQVSVLLVYGKTDLSGKNETAEWEKIIRENYPEYKNLLLK